MTDKTTPPSQNSASSIWGGRFAGGPSQLMLDINASISYDKALFRQDIAGSRAHATMLQAAGILTADDLAAITTGLAQIETEIADGIFTFSEALEDIHMNVEARLAELIGDPARRLHTARSRNDQVATDIRLWLRDAIDGLDDQLRALQSALLTQADAHAETVMPGYTHLQTAQPITFGFHLMAYVQMMGRDRSRLADCRKRMNESPLGAAALAGTSHPIDRHQTATLLGFDRPMENAMDAVSARDFAVEFMAAAAICATHLSRLAEEIVIWSTDRFAFISLSDAFTTGSSIMPQKRNPDAAELIRAKPGRIIGDLVSLLTVLKGLPLAYGKDMQEDKEPVFDAEASLAVCLAAMTGMIDDMSVNQQAMRAALASGHPAATDLADYLVSALKMPFRDAHHITGRIVSLADTHHCALDELPLSAMQEIEPRLDEAVQTVLSIDHCVAARNSFGGTAPDEVRARIAAARKAFLEG
ncbi:MAG: argininosuccinate lyase [Alphaproteobacteria bacterium]|mgnify:FL=1|nr:argininosuccinate lyase [Alphaproteobacteria bacterium]